MRRLSILLLASILPILLAWWLLRPEPMAGKSEPPTTLVGDGKADNTQAIRNLLLKDGTITFPRGVFRITEPIVINLDSTGPVAIVANGNATLLMDGPGPAFRFVGTHAGTAAPKTVKPNVWEKQRTPTIAGLEIVGRHAEADAIEAEGTMQLTLDRVTSASAGMACIW
jgi:hypothetical protein